MTPKHVRILSDRMVFSLCIFLLCFHYVEEKSLRTERCPHPDAISSRR